MAIKISGTTVIDNSRNIDNVGTFCATTLFGDGSNLSNLNIPAFVQTPSNTSPADAATGLSDTATLCASSYLSAYGITMCCSQWQVDDNSDFSSPVFNICQAGTSTQTTLTAGTLCTSCTYYWRVRYFDNCGCCSDYSSSTCFTTAASFLPTTLGESFGGGYYAGSICAAGTCYVLIVAPNATGCVNNCQWKTTQTLTGMSSCFDNLQNGYRNTYSYMTSSTHPAGNWTATRTIGGFSDWYLPALCELSQLYINAACLPVGERFESRSYWSSSEATGYVYGATPAAPLVACQKHMGNGSESTSNKQACLPVRTIRRIPF